MYNTYANKKPFNIYPKGLPPPVNPQANLKRVRAATQFQSKNKSSSKLCYDDYVQLHDGRKGTIKFVGPVGYQFDEIWYGIALDTNNGQHDGMVNGRRYFHAKQKTGIFMAPNSIKSVITASKGTRYGILNRIEMKKNHYLGTIKFIGEINKKLMYGIELDKQKGNCSGDKQGITYFHSLPFHGIFLDCNEFKLINNDLIKKENTLNVGGLPPLPKEKNDDSDSDNEMDDDLLSNPESIDINVNTNFNSILSSFKKTNQFNNNYSLQEPGSSIITPMKQRSNTIGSSNNKKKKTAKVIEQSQAPLVNDPSIINDYSSSSSQYGYDYDYNNSQYGGYDYDYSNYDYDYGYQQRQNNSSGLPPPPPTNNTLPKKVVKHIKIESNMAPLKQYPDGPFDIRSTEEDFYKAAELIMLSCNNPRGLFKVLKGVCSKLRHNDAKYRVIDPVNPAVQKKLFNYEGTDDFLRALGFSPDESTQCWICADDQPPLCVLSAGINVCNELITKCNQKRSKISDLRKFSRFNKDKNELQSEMKEKLPQIKTKINKPKSPSSISSQNMSFTESSDDTNSKTSDDKGGDEDLDGDNDRFQLQDIIWSITHQGNKDNDIRNVLLLCHRVFTTSEDILKMLEMRFFSNEGSELAQWEVQVKVVSLIQHWLRTYWFEDFELQGNMEILLEEFVEKIKDYYSSTNLDKGKKLGDMIEKTIQFQKKNLEKIHLVESAMLSKAKSIKLLGGNDDIKENINEKKQKKNISINELYDEFMKQDNIKISENLCLLDFEYFSKVKPRECLSQNWKSKNKEITAKNICLLIKQFNNISKWVQFSILNAKDIKKRGRIIKKWVKIATELFIRKDFQSLSAVQSALNSTPIFRLKTSWKQIPAKHLVKFEEFKIIFKSSNNMANLRKIHREAHAPMVPYTGIFLQDLFNIDEGTDQYKADGTVNFAKLMRMHEQIDKLMLLQKTPFIFKKDEKIIKIIKNNINKFKNLNDKQLYALSDSVHEKEKKK